VSPIVDVTSASAVSLRFFHSIDALPPPWGEASVEVWNGKAWVKVWEYLEKPPSCTANEWSKVTVDLTAHKNEALRIRFGLANHIEGTEFYGWAIDDVAITSPPSASCE